MRRIVFLLCGILMVQFVCAETSIREQRNLLKKFDLKDTLATFDSPGKYWPFIQENSRSFQSALKAAKSGKAREAQRAIGLAISEIRGTMPPKEDLGEVDELLDSLVAGSGIREILPHEAKLYLDMSEYPNAFALPDGTVYMTAGMLIRREFDYNLLMCVYAHELTHVILQHSFLAAHDAVKRKKKAEMMTGIFTAVSVGAAMYADISLASNGINTYGDYTTDAVRLSQEVKKSLNKSAQTISMVYGREQEYEADILGYRFIRSLGIDGRYYVEMLRRLNSKLEIFSNDESTHPLTDDRIALIEYIRTNPSLKMHYNEVLDDDIYVKDEF